VGAKRFEESGKRFGMKHLNDNELVLALDGEMDEAGLKQAVDHMAECDECRERWEKLQGLSARVVEYQASLYEKALAADERRSTLIESPKSFRFPAWGWGLVAALVLVGVSVGVWNSSRSTDAHPIERSFQAPPQAAPPRAVLAQSGASAALTDQNPRDKDGAQATPAGQVAANTAPSLGLKPTQSGASAIVKPVRSLKTHSVKKTPAADKPDTKLAQFTELPFSDASLPLDQATVVRVTLPAAALRQAGVAVNEDNANAMLKADVVLGMDGLPRGIRLVNQGSSGTN
jgi:anti-sigma factor RsiW